MDNLPFIPMHLRHTHRRLNPEPETQIIYTGVEESQAESIAQLIEKYCLIKLTYVTGDYPTPQVDFYLNPNQEMAYVISVAELAGMIRGISIALSNFGIHEKGNES